MTEINIPSAHELAENWTWLRGRPEPLRSRLLAILDRKEGSVAAPSVGIKRQHTPDSKVAVPIKKRQFAKEAPLAKEAATATRAASDERTCQVCQRRMTWHTGAAAWEPVALNARGDPIKVPGSFCSKECYEHV